MQGGHILWNEGFKTITLEIHPIWNFVIEL